MAQKERYYVMFDTAAVVLDDFSGSWLALLIELLLVGFRTVSRMCPMMVGLVSSSANPHD